MSFTYVKATMLSPHYLDDFYTRHPGIEKKNYATQYQAIMADAHVWADHISRNLKNFGVKAHELIYNAEYLNHAWAKEYGTLAEGPDLFIEQIRSFAPDVVFLHTYYPLYAELVPLIRERIPEVRLIQGYIGVGFTKEHFDVFRSLDFVITNEFTNYVKLTDAGARAYHIYHGFEHTLLKRMPPASPEYDVLFTGSLVMADGYHLKRCELLSHLIENDVNLTILSQPVEAKARIPEILRERIHPAVYGFDMLRTLSRAKVAVNIHIDALPTASNIRLFEATGVGTCLLTDKIPGLEDLFEPEMEVATYQSFEECVEKIRWLLEQPAKRQAIAEAGRKRTLNHHRMEQRVQQLYEIITKELNRTSGGCR